MSAPEWLRVGAEVGTYTNERTSAYAHAPARSVVTKVGKRDVVLENGQRFNVALLSRNTGTWDTGTWATIYLVPADDPAFLRKLREREVYDTTRKVERLMESLRKAPDDLKSAHDAVALLQRLIGDAS